MKKILLVFYAFIVAFASIAQTALEQWRDHLPFTETHTVLYGNKQIYCAGPYMVYSYSLSDNSIEKATKINVLSDVRISTIAFDQYSGTLVVGYENGNLDLIKNGSTFNLNAILNSNFFGQKRINQILTEQGKAYVSTGFGIVYIDLQNQEVIDSYIIGPGGAAVQVNAVNKHNGFIYAATDIGLFRADASNTFLANFNNWSFMNEIPNANRAVTHLVVHSNQLVLLQLADSGNEDVVFVTAEGQNWVELRSGEDMRGLNASSERLAILNRDFVEVLNLSFEYEYVAYFGLTSQRLRCNSAYIRSANEIWLGDERRGVRRYDPFSEAIEDIHPKAPRHPDGYASMFVNNTFFKISGTPASNWTSSFNARGFEVLKDGEWITYDNSLTPFFNENGIRDVMVIAVHPDDENHWFVGTWGYGLIEFRNGDVVNWYNEQNSPLMGSGATPNAAVGGLQFDDDKNLWMTNGYSDTPILVLDNQGDWHAFNDAGAGGSSLYSQLLIAQSGHKWAVRPRGNGIVVYNDNNTIDDSSDDEGVSITSQAGQGNLPTMDVYTIAEDLNGEIWVGTGEGVAVFYAAGSVFSGNNFDAQQILLEQDGNIQILLETERVRSIAVDGANRKWLGTEGSGVFLMSPDGTEQVYHFTEKNSPLPSNNVTAISIDGETGEVYFSTDLGTASFRGTATDGLASNTCRKVYPNPVRPGYEGPIAIEGLERNTNVKITDVAGNLVFETTSEGGQAVWDGYNVRGNPVTTGVYTALCVAPEANSSCVAKIMVIR